jgi:EmrB/QacA subfamily drug resistance transporter
VAEAGRQMQAEPDPKRWAVVAVLGVAFLMVVLDVSIVNVALPSIEGDLNFSPEDLQWVVSAYSLTFGGFLLLGGRLGDILGRRRLFMVGLATFSICSLLCGLSVSSGMLIGMRALQGAAAAILSPSVYSIVSVTFREGPERNKALGVLGAITGSGSAIGVLLGGVLTEYAGWEWIFFVNVPIGLVTLLAVPRFVSESRVEGMARRFDAVGAVVVTAGLMILVYALTQANNVGWGTVRTIGLLIGSGVLLTAFVFIEKRSRSPLVALGFFRHRTPTGANIIGLGLGTIIFGMFFLISLYMQQILGYSALKTGVGYLAVALTAIAASAVGQSLVTRIGVKPVLALGNLLLGVGLLLFTFISVDGDYWSDLFPGFMFLGVGLGFAFVPVSIAALAGIKPSEAGLASGLINTSQQIGGALGVAILATVATSRTTDLLADGEPRPEALTNGYSAAFWVALGFAVANFLLTLLVLRRKELAPTPEGAAAAM